MSNPCIGVDLGGTKTVVVRTTREGEIEASMRFATAPSGSPEADLALLRQRIDLLLEGQSPYAMGVAAPGPLDPKRGVVFNTPNILGWRDAVVPLGPFLEAAFGVPVALENDANAAALAEWYFGAGQGCDNLVLLTMSTGVGGGLILGGRPYRGQACAAGELGHLPVQWDGEPCGCGLRGCLEAYVGGLNWQNRLRQICPADSRVAKLAGGRQTITPVHLVEAAHQGDVFALGEMHRFVDYLSRAMVAIVFAFSPERILLGTIAAAAGEALCFAPLRRILKTRLWPHLWQGLTIAPAGLGADLPAQTAAAVALAAAQRRQGEAC